jgi:GNAT superfamily N-acetyltransferase
MSINYRIATKDDFIHLSKLRIQVFYEYPYIYQGTIDYELAYLNTYLKSQNSRIFLALKDDLIIGATSCLPLIDEEANVVNPITSAGFDPSEFLYFGESVLLPEHRGRGIGVKFFELREAYAINLNFKYCVFCSVIRPDNHPLKPTLYKPLDLFWEKRGYQKMDNCFASFDWLDRNETQSTTKQLQFWIKRVS